MSSITEQFSWVIKTPIGLITEPLSLIRRPTDVTKRDDFPRTISYSSIFLLVLAISSYFSAASLPLWLKVIITLTLPAVSLLLQRKTATDVVDRWDSLALFDGFIHAGYIFFYAAIAIFAGLWLPKLLALAVFFLVSLLMMLGTARYLAARPQRRPY